MTPVLIALSLSLAQATPAPAEDDKPDVAALQQVYEQSCAAREYGAYDDMCDQLRKQIRAAQVDEERAARSKPVHKPPLKSDVASPPSAPPKG